LPELPEVETIVRDLRGLVVGRRIDFVKVWLNKLVRTGPRRLAGFLLGAEIHGVRRRGKFIVFTLSGEKRLVVHLRMTGQFLWAAAPETRPKHVHLIIGFEEGGVLMYRDVRQFGYFLGLQPADYQAWLVSEDIGPDPFDLSPEDFRERLCSRRGRIKPLLLDQRFVSGLGNIYVDEALFAAGIHPLSPADRIREDEARRLFDEILSVLKEAIRLRGSTVRDYRGLTGVGGQFQSRHQVYGRTGEHCLVCGCALERLVVGGRSTHICPRCQPRR